jgi:proteic killer suppression protein
VRFRFKSKKLEALYTSEKGARKYAPEVVDAFFEVMAVIRAMKDERDLRALKSLHFERLSGSRQHQHSLRLGAQWRLIIELEKDAQGNYVLIVRIEDYH